MRCDGRHEGRSGSGQVPPPPAPVPEAKRVIAHGAVCTPLRCGRQHQSRRLQFQRPELSQWWPRSKRWPQLGFSPGRAGRTVQGQVNVECEGISVSGYIRMNLLSLRLRFQSRLRQRRPKIHESSAPRRSPMSQAASFYVPPPVPPPKAPPVPPKQAGVDRLSFGGCAGKLHQPRWRRRRCCDLRPERHRRGHWVVTASTQGSASARRPWHLPRQHLPALLRPRTFIQNAKPIPS